MTAAPQASADRSGAGRRRLFLSSWRRVLAALVLATSVPLLAPAPPADAATACRTVGGASAPADGGRHATVVIDTGSGPVWSACITFSGTVSGTDALELAARQISDLNPVYDTYSGEGKAVCKLRGVGNDPPGCLGKTAAYWNYTRNGRYSSVGAGSTKVDDGDVEGWRWGTGSASVRPATAGTEATTASVPPTRPPAPTPAQPGTNPGPMSPTVTPPGATVGGGTKGGVLVAPRPGAPTTTAPGQTGSPTTIAGAASTSTPEAVPSSTVPSSTAPAPTSAPAPAPGTRVGDSRRSAAGAGEQAGARVRSGPGPVAALDKKSERSGVTSAVALVGLLVLAGGAGVLVRKRRRAAAATT